jgi:hypothetical protein
MNQKIAGTIHILFALICIVFGIDKLIEFLPTWSLTSHIFQTGMIVTGVLEIGIGIMLFLKKYTLLSLKLGTAIMFGGMLVHVIDGTYDFSGALVGLIMGMFLIYEHK